MNTKVSSGVKSFSLFKGIFIYLLITLLTFFPMVILRFGRLDDFSFWLYTRDDPQGVVTSGLSFGRPVTTLIIGKSFELVPGIEGFSIIRAGSLLLLLLIAYLAFNFYRVENKPEPILSIFFLLYFVSLPGLWVFMSWAQGLPHILGFLFVFISVIAYCRPHGQKYYFAFSFLAFFTYQPFGLLIPILLVPKLFRERSSNLIREFIKIYMWITVLCLMNYLLIKSQSAPNSRSQLTSDFSLKLSWFVSEWTPRVLFPWSLQVNVFGAVIAGIAFVFVFQDFLRKERISRAMILLLSIILPSVPFLITSENWASSRAILASNISFTVGISFLIMKYFSLKRRNLMLKLMSVAFASVFFMNSIYTGYGSLVLPQSQEWKGTLSAVALAPKETKEITGHLAFFEQSPSASLSYDEFGVLNSTVSDPLTGMLRMAMSNLWLAKLPLNIDLERKCQDSVSSLNLETNRFNLYPLVGMPGC